MPTIGSLASPSDHGRLAGYCPTQWKLAVAAADAHDGWPADSCLHAALQAQSSGATSVCISLRIVYVR